MRSCFTNTATKQRTKAVRNENIFFSHRKLISGCGAQLLCKFGTEKPVRAQPSKPVSICEPPPTTNPSMTLSNQDYYANFNIYTKFGDLQPSELFTLFCEFRMLPQYFSCNFLPSLRSILLKMGARTDEGGTPDVAKPIDDSCNSIDDEVVEIECKEAEKK